MRDDELARRVALIHAELWVADETEQASRSALASAFDALGDLLHDVDGAARVTNELIELHALAEAHLAGTIDLRDIVSAADADQSDVRHGRAHVEARLSDLLRAVLGLPSASERAAVSA